MKIKTQEFEVEIEVKGIEVLGITLPIPEDFSEKPVSHSFQIELDQRVDLATELVFIISYVSIISEDEPKETQYKGGITVSCFFEIKDLASKVTINENGIVTIPGGLIQVLNSISVSTTRGVMFASFKGTHLHNAIIPMVDPSRFKPKETK